MDFRRLFLFLSLALVLILLWTAWQREHPVSRPRAVTSTTSTSRQFTPTRLPSESSAVSQASASSASRPSSETQAPIKLQAPAGRRLNLANNVLSLGIALAGGSIIHAELRKYPEKSGSTASYVLLGTDKTKFLIIAPKLEGIGLPARRIYRVEAVAHYEKPGEHQVSMPLVWQGKGIRVTRIYSLKPGSYVVGVKTQVENLGNKPRTVASVLQLIGRNPVLATHLWDNFLPKYWSYRGPGYYAAGSYEKESSAGLAQKPFNKRVKGGWIGVVNQYFDAVAIPPPGSIQGFFGRAVATGDGFLVGYRGHPRELAPGASTTFSSQLYLGPKLQGKLDQIAPGLARTVDYGKATIISAPLFSVLSRVHSLVGNWGWAIIILVLLIKAIFYWPQRIGARSMAKMRKLQPRVKHLQERYKDDKQKLSKAMMELYRKEGANPVSGCLPMLIQAPIFIGLFYVLTYSVELRLAPWVFWIHDLSAPDPYYVLPVIYAFLMLVQFRLQPQMGDKNQARLLMAMPLLFAFMYAIFPSGLVLYYLFSTLLNILIQWQVNRELGVPMPRLNPFNKKA